MGKCFVQIGSDVALIFLEDSQQCWVLTRKNPALPQKESRSRMYDIRHSTGFLVQVIVDEEYPFSDIRQAFQKNMRRTELLHFTISSLDADLSMGVRKDYADLVSSIVEKKYGKWALKWVCKLISSSPIPEGAQIDKEVLCCFPESLQDTVQKLFERKFSTDKEFGICPICKTEQEVVAYVPSEMPMFVVREGVKEGDKIFTLHCNLEKKHCAGAGWALQ